MPSVLTYVLATQKSRLIETVLLSTHNICFEREIRKLFFFGTHFFLKAWHHNDGNLLHCNFSCLLIGRPTNKFEINCIFFFFFFLTNIIITYIFFIHVPVVHMLLSTFAMLN